MSSDETQEEMLEELRRIREAVEPKPTQPQEPPKGFRAEFRAFLEKRGIVGLALAVIIGGAAGKLVSALVDDIFMPIITAFIPNGEWRDLAIAVGSQEIKAGHFVGVLLDFVIIAIIVFAVMKQLEKVGIQ